MILTAVVPAGLHRGNDGQVALRDVDRGMYVFQKEGFMGLSMSFTAGSLDFAWNVTASDSEGAVVILNDLDYLAPKGCFIEYREENKRVENTRFGERPTTRWRLISLCNEPAIGILSKCYEIEAKTNLPLQSPTSTAQRGGNEALTFLFQPLPTPTTQSGGNQVLIDIDPKVIIILVASIVIALIICAISGLFILRLVKSRKSKRHSAMNSTTELTRPFDSTIPDDAASRTEATSFTFTNITMSVHSIGIIFIQVLF
jgi:hypothetical protein